MFTLRTLPAAAAVLLTTACTTLGMSPVSKPELPSADDKVFVCSQAASAPAAAECSAADARKSLAAALNYCAQLADYYDRNGGVTTGQRLFIGVAGSLAGSVFALTAGGTAAKAWSGFSGAANGLQTQLDSAADRVGNNGRRQVIAAQVAEAQRTLNADSVKSRPDEIVLQSRFLVSRCATAAATPASGAL